MTEFGVLLSTRDVLKGTGTMDDLRDLAMRVDAEDAWSGAWVGDSILARPRVESIVLLSAIAAWTRRVRIGVSCFASIPVRNPLILAHQWASLDVLSGGRATFAACHGLGSGDVHSGSRDELLTFGVEPPTRMKRMEEAIEILRLTTSREHASYEGEFNRFSDVTILPRPVQQPVPIWVVANPNPDDARSVERALRRVARLGDGWMTTFTTPEVFRRHLELIQNYAGERARRLDRFDACLYYDITVGDDADSAFGECKRFLDDYYGIDYDPAIIRRSAAFGTGKECAARLRLYIDAGATSIVLRLAAADQAAQLERVTREVLPELL